MTWAFFFSETSLRSRFFELRKEDANERLRLHPDVHGGAGVAGVGVAHGVVGRGVGGGRQRTISSAALLTPRQQSVASSRTLAPLHESAFSVQQPPPPAGSE